VNVTGTFVVGKVSLGQYVIQVSGSAGDSAQAVFNVASGPTITLKPANGDADTYVAVSGSSFLPTDNFCTISSPGSNAVLAGTAECAINSSSGVVSGSFTIGTVLPGQYVIMVIGNMGDFAQAVLAVSITSQTSTTTIAVSGTHVAFQLSTTGANGKSISSFTGSGTMLVQAILPKRWFSLR
jgi:roadblock/LC7 domain-containing protein